MIILGIDPGTSIVGHAVIEKTPSGVIRLISSGAIRPLKQESGNKLREVHLAINKIIDIHRPDIIALEKIFFSKNIKTALSVAEARGMLLLTAALKQIKVFEYNPLSVKMAVTGYGKADKQQIQSMMKILLRLESVPQLDDITDAMAIAMTALQEKI